MELFALPTVIRGLIFDIDNTLYRNDAYTRDQTLMLVERLARERNEPVSVTTKLVEDFRARIGRETGGKPSLGNTFLHFGISIQESVRWREEVLAPERYLAPDPELADHLGALARKYPLCCITNNPATIGWRTLRTLEIESKFRFVIGLEDTMVSKPNRAPFELAARRLGLPPDTLVSVGDRYEVDLEPALALGMGAIRVDSRDDLFRLPV